MLSEGKLEELEPCPFCGSAAMPQQDLHRWDIECNNCGARVVGSYSLASAIAAWNTRAQAPAPVELIKSVTRCLAGFPAHIDRDGVGHFNLRLTCGQAELLIKALALCVLPRSQNEREWTDKFGTHWEVRQVGAGGQIYTSKITRTATGGPDRDAARAAITKATSQQPQAPQAKEPRDDI